MVKEEIILPDGRYVIFYRFETEDDGASAADS
jgi:hypothetical protein